MPLLLTQTATRASAAPARGRPTKASPSTYHPTWQLAADHIHDAQRGTTPAQSSAGITQSAQPTTPAPTTAAAPTTTTTTTAPAPAPTTTTTAPAPTTTTTTAPARVAGNGSQRTGVVTYYDDPGGPGTCASPSLPFGTVVSITNPANGASVECTVDDREADTARQIDLDTATFAELAPLSQGVIDDAQLSW